MKFELDYKDLHFIITLNVEDNFIPDNRFEKLSNQSLSMLKKNEITPYSILIESEKNGESLTFFISSVLLSSKKDEIIDDLQDYLEADNVIEEITSKWKLSEEENGPSWKK